MRSTSRSPMPRCSRSAHRSAPARSSSSRRTRAGSARRPGSPATSRGRAQASAGRACSAFRSIGRRARNGSTLDRLRRLAPQVAGRGACAHPTGATRLVASAARVFADEIERHRAGRCSGRSHAHVLPLRYVPRVEMSTMRAPPCQPDPVRRLRPLRGAPAGAGRARRVGISDRAATTPSTAVSSRRARRAVKMCPRLALSLEESTQ